MLDNLLWAAVGWLVGYFFCRLMNTLDSRSA